MSLLETKTATIGRVSIYRIDPSKDKRIFKTLRPEKSFPFLEKSFPILITEKTRDYSYPIMFIGLLGYDLFFFFFGKRAKKGQKRRLPPS